jgi:uncharacterized protein (TIGR02271 family)
MTMSHEDRHVFGEGLNRGGFMLCAEVDDDESADKIVSVLEQTSGVDLDERQDTWRQEGWQPYSGAGAGTFAGGDRSRETDRSVEEERIPIVEEQINVGKREVNRGGARIRSYVKETPVHEQVNLREEHVSVERRPVSGETTMNAGDAAFQERNIEMTETSEVPVVEKEARVTEEMVVKKTVDQHTENVEDTVRRTEVEVDEGRSSGDRSGTGFGRDNDNR